MSEAEANSRLDGIPWPRLIDLTPLPVSVVSVAGRQLYGNPAYAAFLGYSLDDLVDLDVSTLTLESDRAWTTAYLRRLASGELDRFSTAKTFVRKDGSTVMGVLASVPVFREGRCVALIGTITPMQRSLPFADSKLRKLIENVSDTISLVDRDGRVLDTSGRYTPILGYPREFWEERTLFDLVVDSDLPTLTAMQAKVLAAPGELVTGEIHIRDSHGDPQSVAVSAVNLLDDPDVGGVVLTTHNITPLRRLIDELSVSRDEAVAEAELRSRLVATVSHELRNPLHAVLGISELLASGAAGADSERLAGVLNRQMRDLARIVDDLLTSSRIEAGTLTIVPEPVDIRAIIDDLVGVHAGTAGRGVVLRPTVDAGVPGEILIDPVRLRQIVGNLLGNAVKFTPSGTVEVRVGVDVQTLTVAVADTGVGIEADEVEKIFEPFVTGSHAPEGAGAGLGLSIVQRIVDAMGGTVGMRSAPGSGTTVTVSLPIGVVDARTAGARAGEAAPSIHAIHALVVDDNEVNLQLAATQLHVLGHVGTVVGSGDAALELLADPAFAPVDVVLMDVHLPGMDGVETTRRIRALDERLGRPRRIIVGVTASSLVGDHAAAVAAGMDAHLPKPVRLAELERCLVRVLGGDRSAPDDRRGDDTPVVVAAAAAAALAPGRPAADSVVDLGVLDELAAELGGRSLVEGIVRTYLGELDRRVNGIIAAVDAADSPRRNLLVHTLASSSRLVGADALAELTEAYPGALDAVDAVAVRTTADRVAYDLARWLSP